MERQRDIATERDRQRDRERGIERKEQKETDREREKDRDKWTEREREREREREIERERKIETEKEFALVFLDQNNKNKTSFVRIDKSYYAQNNLVRLLEHKITFAIFGDYTNAIL